MALVIESLRKTIHAASTAAWTTANHAARAASGRRASGRCRPSPRSTARHTPWMPPQTM